MKMNRLLWIFPLAAVLLTAGCAAPEPASEAASAADAEIAALAAESAGPAPIDLSAPDAAPAGVTWQDGVFTVVRSGSYRITGSAAGGVTVDADGPVELILAGAELRGPQALRVLSGGAVTVTAEAGTENTLSDGADAPDENASAVIWSKAPLTLGGEGALTVLSGAGNGIQSKSVLTVAGGALTVRAANDGLKADGVLTVSGGRLDITAGGDGLQCDAGRVGYGDVTVSGGDVAVTAGKRGIRGEGTVLLSGGSLRIGSLTDGVRGYAVTAAGGDLSVSAAGDGIQADGLVWISGGRLALTAGEDGLRGGYVTVSDGSLSLNAAGDGIQADALVALSGGSVDITAGEDALRGQEANIAGGAVTLDAAGDGVQADSLVTVSGGTLSVTAGGGGGAAIEKSGDDFGPPMWTSRNQETTEDVSAKGIKSDGSILITGGVIGLSTADDAVHAAVLCTVEGGEITILSSDDALHADDMLVIEDGDVNITDCFEGLEAFAIEVNGGHIVIRAVNDGVNANGSEFFMPWGRDRSSGEENAFVSVSGSDTTYYRQTGGTVDLVVTGNMNNVGDGVDSNGYVYIDGGVLTVSTFGNTMEGGIDTGRDGPVVTGGMVMSGGSAMMQESWAAGSTQCCAVIYVSLQAGGTPVTIYDGDGNELWTVTLANPFNCIVLSHPGLEPGRVYTVDYGGGTETLDFSTSTNLRVGSGGGGFPGRW